MTTTTQTYKEALTAGRKVGAANADDPQLMAMFLDTSIQILCGAVSPQLVWEGAQKKGLTSTEVAALASENPRAIEGLMWA